MPTVVDPWSDLVDEQLSIRHGEQFNGHHPDVIKRMAESGVSIITSKTTADFATFWKEEHERFAKVVRDAKIPTE